MKGRLVLSVFLVLILVVSISFVSAQTYSGFSKLKDNVKLFFSSGDGKVKLALEIREKEINSAIDNAKSGNNQGAIKNLESAKNKLKIVQDRISPTTAEEVKSNVENIQNIIEENKDVNSEASVYFDKYLTEEEKTKLSVDLYEKVLNYCKELASQNYDLMLKDEKCKSYSWMKSVITKEVKTENLQVTENIKKAVAVCMNNPKDCNCDEISLASEKASCEKYKAFAVRCEFQGDTSACDKISEIKIEDTQEKNKQIKDDIEKEILEKYLPGECLDAGIRDGEECKKLILTLNQPKSECLENGEYIGEEKCKEKLVKDGNVINECVVDGKLVDSAQCLKNVKEGNKPTGKEWELMSGECKELGIYDIVACNAMVNVSRPCINAGIYTQKECEALTLNKNFPKECVDAGALTPEACEKLKLPSDCQGANSREECEQIKIELKYPEECKSAGEFDTAKCAVIIVEGEESLVVTAGAEVEYLARQGLTFEEIPKVCVEGINFIRSDSCDAELAKLGIILPKPTATFGIAKECMVDERTTVSPEECKNKIEKKIIVDTMPKECQDAQITNPEDCSDFMGEKRMEQGIGINMPTECMGISIEECKTIMKEKGIEINKIEQTQNNLPKECREMGVSDVKDCDMIAGRINEERIKNGEKMIIDENGKVDYINPEQIEKIADDSEKASQEFKPDFEKAEGMKQEIANVEKSIQEIGESHNVRPDTGGASGSNEVVSSGSANTESGSGDNVVVSSGSGGGSGGNEVVTESSGGENGGGESSPMTGGAIGSSNSNSFMKRFFDWLF